MSIRTYLLLSFAIEAACAGAAGPASRAFTGKAPLDTRVDLRGAFTFSASGELALALVEPCTVVHKTSHQGVVEDLCDRAHLSATKVTAATPWRSEIPGAWIDPSHLVFRVDWKQSGLDPLAENADELVAKPWSVSGTEWAPTREEAARILKLVGDATETETELVRGGIAPNLEVTGFEVAGGTLRAGAEATLTVKVANRGPGTAYRVVATTRSSVPSLDGQRLAFGMIKPRSEKVRQLRVTVPAGETSSDTMLVLLLAEGNGFTPRNVSRRVPIAASSTVQAVAVRCSLPGRSGPRPDLDAGESVVLRCVVDNSGTALARVELESSIAGSAPVVSPAQDVAAAGHAIFDVPITVPRELAIDSSVEIAVTARDRESDRTARAAVIGVVRKPKLCASGQLTRAQYRAKITQLRAAVAAGDMTQQQFDRYDAELVTCLK